jgi:hypothetical protein
MPLLIVIGPTGSPVSLRCNDQRLATRSFVPSRLVCPSSPSDPPVCASGPDAHGYIAETRHHDNRQLQTLLSQTILKIEPAHTRKTHIHHDASRRSRGPGVEERARRFIV